MTGRRGTGAKAPARLREVALLSVSLLVGLQLSVNPIVPLLVEAFPSRTRPEVEALATAQGLTVMVAVLLSAPLATRFGRRRVVELGSLVVCLAGAAPALGGGYEAVLASRLFLGVGTGLVNGLAISLIGDGYDGQERSRLLGVRGTVEVCGQTLGVVGSSLLALGGWRMSFLVYLVALPVLVLFALGAPRGQEKSCDGHPRQASGTWGHVAVAVLVLVCFNLVYQALGIRISSVADGVQASPLETGAIVASMSVAGGVAGVAYGRLARRLRGHLVAVAYGLLAIACLLVPVARHAVVLLASAVLGGTSFTLVVTAAMDDVSSHAAGSSGLPVSVLVAALNGASFLAPRVLGLVDQVLGGGLSTAFLPYAALLGVIAVAMELSCGRARGLRA